MALFGSAWAQQPIELTSGSTALQPCLDEAACSGVLLDLVSETLVEFGWFQQHDALQGGALVGRGTGFVFELHVDSYTLGRRNFITEEVALPPVLPKLEVGYQLGSFTYDDPFPQLAASVVLFPPIAADGYRLSNVAAQVSGAVPVVDHRVWLGLELGLSHGATSGEMLGDGGVLEDVDAVAPFVDLEEPACAELAEGCIDRIRQTAFTAKVGVAVEPIPELFLFSKVGLGRQATALAIAYDASAWKMTGVLPQLSYGGGVRIGDRVLLSLGGATAWKSADASTDGVRAMSRLQVGFAIRTGDARYWFEEEDETPPAN